MGNRVNLVPGQRLPKQARPRPTTPLTLPNLSHPLEDRAEPGWSGLTMAWHDPFNMFKFNEQFIKKTIILNLQLVQCTAYDHVSFRLIYGQRRWSFNTSNFKDWVKILDSVATPNGKPIALLSVAITSSRHEYHQRKLYFL